MQTYAYKLAFSHFLAATENCDSWKISHKKKMIYTVQPTPFEIEPHPIHSGLKLKWCPIRLLLPILTLSLTPGSTSPHNSPGHTQYDQANLLLSYQTLTALGYGSALYLPTCSNVQTHIIFFAFDNFKQQKSHERKICNLLVIFLLFFAPYMPGLLASDTTKMS